MISQKPTRRNGTSWSFLCEHHQPWRHETGRRIFELPISDFFKISSGKLHNYGKSPCFSWVNQLKMVIFKSYVKSTNLCWFLSPLLFNLLQHTPTAAFDTSPSTVSEDAKGTSGPGTESRLSKNYQNLRSYL